MDRIKLKLDMIYRGKPVEEARKEYAAMVPEVPPPVVETPPVRRKFRAVVKA